MRARFRDRRPSPSLVISLIALFVALSGTSYAALALPKSSVGTKQLKKDAVTAGKIKSNAVTTGKVKNGSLRAQDFKPGDLPAGAKGDTGVKGATGATGAKGATGAPGEPGTAAGFARVDASGTLIGGAAQNKGVGQVDVQHDPGAPAAESTGAGVYCFGGLDFTPTSAVVALDNTDSLPAAPSLTGGALNFIPSVAVFKGEDFGRCDAAHGQARVAIQQVSDTVAPTLANHGFSVWFEK
jgi:hypothetical protein